MPAHWYMPESSLSPAQPAAEIGGAFELGGFGVVEDEAVAVKHPLAVENVVLGGLEGAVPGLPDGVIGDAVPAVAEIPGVPDLEQIRALQHVLGHGRVDGALKAPVFQILGGIFCDHASQGVAPGGNQQPVALLLLHPEDLGVPEIVLGIALRGKEAILRPLLPALAVGADGVHHALLAPAAVAAVIVPGVEQVIQAVLILHDGACAQGGIRLGHQTVVQRHALVGVAAEICGAVLVDGVVALAVVVRVIEIVELQCALVGDKGHGVAHVGALRGRVELVLHRGIGLVRKRTRSAAGAQEERGGQQQNRQGHSFSHGASSFQSKFANANMNVHMHTSIHSLYTLFCGCQEGKRKKQGSGLQKTYNKKAFQRLCLTIAAEMCIFTLFIWVCQTRLCEVTTCSA